jgi:hypothetical protein
VRLSDDFFFQGERAKVRIRADRAGYLVVLRMDADGRIRPIFPVDPDDSSLVAQGKEYEVRSRGDREAFTVDERDGTGYVLAALSDVPWDFTRFAQVNHWDYRAFNASESSDDAEMILRELIDSMTTSTYDYDLARYSVGANRSARYYSGWFGRPRYYDPWYHSYSPFYGPRIGFTFGLGFGGRSHFRRRGHW